MFLCVLDGIIKCRQSDGSCTGFKGALNMLLKILFDIGMAELTMVDYWWADDSFAEDLLATEQTA
eukprot:4256824-Ditylum_brightwellii.AAC.1